MRGKTDQEITEFQEKGTSGPLITAPIAGTIVQRKVGPGQYVGSGQTDPVFIIGDLSKFAISIRPSSGIPSTIWSAESLRPGRRMSAAH
jgi:multidrug efflux pump subunit AcrA (membrane-fusion protein)